MTGIRRGTLRIIGLGNPLRGDDGLGCAAIEALNRRRLPAAVELIDLGTGGLNLLPYLEEPGALILIDAVDAGQAPGTLLRLDTEDLLNGAGDGFFSQHEGNIGEVLQLARAMGQPLNVVLFGVQVEAVTLGTGLSATVAAALPPLLQAIEEELAREKNS